MHTTLLSPRLAPGKYPIGAFIPQKGGIISKRTNQYCECPQAAGDCAVACLLSRVLLQLLTRCQQSQQVPHFESTLADSTHA